MIGTIQTAIEEHLTGVCRVTKGTKCNEEPALATARSGLLPEDWWGKKRIGDYNWQGRGGKHKGTSDLSCDMRKISSDRTLGRWTDIWSLLSGLHPSCLLPTVKPNTKPRGHVSTKESSPERSEPQGVDCVRKMCTEQIWRTKMFLHHRGPLL